MPQLHEADLVAVPVPPGPAWPPLLARAWEAGAAVLPVDHRLTDREARAIVRRARPTAVWDGSTVTRLADGIPAQPGDAVAVATAGSTGEPKVAVLGHDAVRAAVDASAERLGATEEHPWLCALPVAHMGGLLCIARALLLGAQVDVLPGFAPDAVADSDAAFTALVPAMLARLLDDGAGLARFGAVLIGGAALPGPLAARAQDAGVRIVRTYGQTESCGGVVYDGVPLRGVTVRIEDGEIVLDGPTLMRGYRLEPDRRGALRTGDAGDILDGRLRVLGRLDDAITTGGETVWPAEVEDALRSHPDVADVAVVGVPDETWGARVVAVVVPGRTPPTLDALQEHARARLAPYKVPRGIVITDSLPRGTAGKVLRPVLVERVQSGASP